MPFEGLIDYRIIYIKNVFKNETSNVLIVYSINVDIICESFKIVSKYKLSIFCVIEISKNALNYALMKNIKIRIILKDH